MDTQQLAPIQLFTPEFVKKLGEFLQVRRDAAVADLDAIKVIENDEQYAEAEQTLATAKQMYDIMSAKRMGFTNPIKDAIAMIMAFENDINYKATTDNHYTRARKVLEEYNQKKILAKQQIEYKAKVRADQIKYKAEFKAKVQQQLADMLAGKNRTVIDSMAAWEGSLTLENIDANEAKLRAQQPTLKQPDYDKCFHEWGQRPDLFAKDQEVAYLEELKNELTYAIYNEKFQQIVAPIKNEYLAKIPAIKANLESIAKATATKQEEMKKAQAAQREAEKQAALKKAAEDEKTAAQAIADEKDMNVMEGDFTQQMMTADIDAGPSKKVASFENDAAWLPVFLQVVTKCAGHSKFKGIHAKEGYVAEIDKWMKFYAANVGEPLKGLKFTEEAKTIVRKKA